MKAVPPMVVVADEENSFLKKYVGPIQLLLEHVAADHLVNLKEIVLTNMSSLSRKRRRQQSTIGSTLEKVCGLYHEACNGNQAWIEIFIDNTFRPFPPIFLRVPFFRNYALAEVLFHEIGHHVHTDSKKEVKNSEEFANYFKSKLYQEYIAKHYWYLRPLFTLLRLLNKCLSKMKVGI